MKGIVVQGVIGRMRMELPNLPDALQRVAEQILEDPAEAAQASIVDLAERAGTSTATVTRFCRVLGFTGYAALRVAIATESGREAQARWETDIDREIEPGDPLDRVLGVIASADARAIQETAARLDLAEVARVADAIAGRQPGRAVRPGQQRHRRPGRWRSGWSASGCPAGTGRTRTRR